MRKSIVAATIFLVTILAFGCHLFCPVNYAGKVAQAQTGPDLTIESITSSPEKPAIGDEVTFTVTISNQGTVTSGQCYVAYYIDEDYLTRDNVPPIDPGASNQYTFTWTAETGSHVITVVADYTEQVSESDEGNNEKTLTLSTLGADLLIDSITWSPANPSVASIVIFTVTIKNQGTFVALAGLVHFYVDDIQHDHKRVERIYPGETVTMNFSWFAKAGLHDIRAIVDKDNSVPENDEENNELTVLFSPFLPDLVIDDITWSPAEPVLSDNVTFTVFVTNQGNGISNTPAVDLSIDDDSLDTGYLDEIEPGASGNVTFSWKARVGTHNIKGVVSSGPVYTESDETNNEKTVTLTTLVADLTVQDIVLSTTDIGVSENITLTVIVENQGGYKSEISRVDLRIDWETLDYKELGELDVGDIAEIDFNWRVREGKHRIQAIVDRRDTVEESDEQNNDKTIFLSTMPADLIIEQITWTPSEPSIGDEVTFICTVKNQGEVRADDTYIVYYIDDSRVSSEHVDSLSANATDNQTFTWTITAREHIIKAFIDFANVVDETDETNNEKAITFLPCLADLIIDSIDWSRNDPAIGEMVTFAVTIANNGRSRSGASLVQLYIDNNRKGYQDIPEMDPGSKVTKTFDWKVTAGTHAVRAVIDDSDLVIESNENNNESLIAYPMPDIAIEAVTWSPMEPAMGDKVTLTVYVKNEGSLKAGGSQLYFCIDDDMVNYQEIPQLDAGARVIKTFEWDVMAGQHVLSLFADGADVITEGVEDNNVETVAFSIPAPDLVIESITWPSGEPPASDNVVFTVTIRNQGDAMSRYAPVSYYVDGQYLASGQVRSLKPNADKDETFSTWIPRTGQHTIRVVIDEGNQVPESNEANNEKAVTFSTENITLPKEKPTPATSSTRPAPIPLTPPEKDYKTEIMFGIAVLLFGSILVLTLLRTIRKPKRPSSDKGEI